MAYGQNARAGIGVAEIVNLRRARKKKARAEKAARAAGKRTRFGRTKAEKREAAAERTHTGQSLDGKKLD